MARVLIVGGDDRGRLLAGALLAAGHSVRVTSEDGREREAIEALGAECWAGTPVRLGTLRGALDGVAIACWLLASAEDAEALALHGERLELFLTQAIDTTVRGIVYEAAGTLPADVLAAGERIVRAATDRNRIPVAFVRADPGDADGWIASVLAAIDGLLDGGSDDVCGSQGVEARGR